MNDKFIGVTTPPPPSHVPTWDQTFPPFKGNGSGESSKVSTSAQSAVVGEDELTADQREAREDYGG